MQLSVRELVGAFNKVKAPSPNSVEITVKFCWQLIDDLGVQVRCGLRLHPRGDVRLLRPGLAAPHAPGPAPRPPGRVPAGAREEHGAQLRRGQEQGEDLRHLHGGRARQAEGRGQVSRRN